MIPSIYIKAPDGTEFYRQIAIFAYASYTQHGFGAVVLKQGEFVTHGDGSVEAHALYIPYSDNADQLPEEAVKLINDYDPMCEVILAMVESSSNATCITITAEQLGSTPKRLFEQAVKIQQHIPVVPGTLVRLKDFIDDIEPGLFVFLGEEKSEMILARAGEDYGGL